MFCKNCGTQLPDGAKFCSNCGTPVTPPAVFEAAGSSSDPIKFPGAGFPGDEVQPPQDPAAGTPAPTDEDPAPAEDSPAWDGIEPQAPAPVSVPVSVPASIPVYAASAADGGSGQLSPGRRGWVLLAVLAGGAVLVILAAVLLVKLITGLGGGKAAYVYLNDDGELMYLADLKEKTQALELTDEADYYTDVAFSSDGKTVYFTDSDRTLYSITVTDLKKGGRPERISRDVSGFFLLKDGKLAYTSNNSGENRLSIYEKGESYYLLRGYSYYRLSEDQNTLYYTQRDSADDTITLYRIPVAKDAKGERLLKGASTICTSYDADVLVYDVRDSGGGSATIYSCTPGGSKTKLVSDVFSIFGVTVDGGKVSFYYYVEDAEERTLYDFVTDANAGADADVLSGEEPTYPYWSDFSINEIWIDDEADAYSLGAVYYINGKGDECPIDVSGLLNETGLTLDDLYGMYWELYDIAYEDAQERYSAAAEDYNERYETWYAAQDRQSMRESLKDSQYHQTSYSLYHYAGGESEPIATGVAEIGPANSANGIFLYRKVSGGSGKVADVADLDYADEVYDLLMYSGSDDDGWYQNVGGKESEIDLDDVVYIWSIYVLNGKEVVLYGYCEDGGSLLQSYTLGRDALTFSSTIIDGENFSLPEMAVVSGTEVLYLFTDTAEDGYHTIGDFCVYRGGELETIAKEIYMALILDESGATYAVTDMDMRSECMELSLLKDGKPTAITDEMEEIEPVFLDGSQLLYISDGDLMLWNGKEERRIARDVEAFWTSAQESFTAYGPGY